MNSENIQPQEHNQIYYICKKIIRDNLYNYIKKNIIIYFLIESYIIWKA